MIGLDHLRKVDLLLGVIDMQIPLLGEKLARLTVQLLLQILAGERCAGENWAAECAAVQREVYTRLAECVFGIPDSSTLYIESAL